MGCGQSKIGNIYPKNKKNKKNNSAKKNANSTCKWASKIFMETSFALRARR